MLSVNSYQPEKKATRESSRDFLTQKKKTKKGTKRTTKFNIKNDPRVIIRGVVYSLTTIVLVAIICFCAYNIIRWQAENDIADEQIRDLQQETVITEIAEEPAETEPTETTQPVVQTIDTHKLLSNTDPYWELVKIPLMDADLSSARAKNADVAGWIQVPGTNINYPFVKTDNNNYYLTHSLNRSWNSAGWVFLDYRNNSNLTDKNQILYAHGRIDGSMFGSLVNVLSANWQNNQSNHVVKISNDTSDSLWQVFSVYKVPVTSDYLKVNFDSDAEFGQFIRMISDRSVYDFKTTVTYADKIITLSTCVGLNDRAVLHAKLIKIAQK